ncbi:MAG: hypothetical protein AABZ55_15990 [Bdellovibrionota bacterium]
MGAYKRKIKVSGKTSSELYNKISTELDKFLLKAQIGKCEVSNEPAHKRISAKGSMFSATIHCKEGEVEMDVNLSFLAAGFRGKIDESIDRWLAKTFGTLT